MIEKVNPSHPDKVADRIAGALVDLAYKKSNSPKVAVEVLVGHGTCHIIAETSVHLQDSEVDAIVHRILGEDADVDYKEVPQDAHLAENQADTPKCGDNGIFKGVPVNAEERTLSQVARLLYREFPTDGKFILDSASNNKLIICQSNATTDRISEYLCWEGELIVNPLGEWTGGTNVDTGATNRKLGSDMGRAVTGGGLHGKDLTKADVAVNIVCHTLAQDLGVDVTACCAIGDEEVLFRPKGKARRSVSYSMVLDAAKRYIDDIGGFEKLAEWGLV